MSLVFTVVLTAAVLAAAAYAHVRLPFHSRDARQALIARLLLLGVGTAFGAVTASVYGDMQGWRWVAAFLSGFGVVHVPAAAILFLKRQRAKG